MSWQHREKSSNDELKWDYNKIKTWSNYDANACALLSRLQLDNLYIRRKKLKAQLMFKILKGNMPPYLQALFSVRNTEYHFKNHQPKAFMKKYAI